MLGTARPARLGRLEPPERRWNGSEAKAEVIYSLPLESPIVTSQLESIVQFCRLRNNTLNLPLGEGSGLGDGLGEGLGRGLRSLRGTRSACSPSSSGFNGSCNLSLGGTEQVSDILREITSSPAAALAVSSSLPRCLRSLGRQDRVSPSLAASWQAQQLEISSISRLYSAVCWSDEVIVVLVVDGSTSKSNCVMVTQCLRAAARAINPANAMWFLRKSTRFNCVPLANDSAKEMIPVHVKPFSWSPKCNNERLRSSPDGIRPMMPSSPNLLWPRFRVWRVWLVAWIKDNCNALQLDWNRWIGYTKTLTKAGDDSWVMPLFQTTREINPTLSKRASHMKPIPLSEISLFLSIEKRIKCLVDNLYLKIKTSSLCAGATNFQWEVSPVVRRRKALICFRPNAAHAGFGSFSKNLLLTCRKASKYLAK